MEPAAGPRGTRCHRQYSFMRQPEVTQRGKGVTTQTCFFTSRGEGASSVSGRGCEPVSGKLGGFSWAFTRARGVRAKGAGPSGRRPKFSVNYCLLLYQTNPTNNDSP